MGSKGIAPHTVTYGETRRTLSPKAGVRSGPGDGLPELFLSVCQFLGDTDQVQFFERPRLDLFQFLACFLSIFYH